MIQYFLLCLFLFLAGCGLLRLFAISDRKVNCSFLLAPPLAFALWTLCIGASIPLGIPVRQSWWAIYLLTVVLAGAGVRFLLLRLEVRHISLLAIPLLLPLAFFYPYLIHGLTAYAGAPAWDGWSYVANGQYLWTYPLGSDGGLRPLYQYGAHLSETRFVGTGFLALLSPMLLQQGETHAARGLFLMSSFFVAACSALFFALQQEWKLRYSFLFVVMAVFAGWLSLAVIANNYDNLLIMTFLPAFAAYCRYGSLASWRSSLLLGLFVASLIYSYAEMSLLALFTGLVLLMGRGEQLRLKIRVVFAAVICGIALLLPYLKILGVYFQRQLAAAEMVSAARPGEGLLPELLSLSQGFPVFWSVWLNAMAELFPQAASFLLAAAWLLALTSAILFVIGCVSLLKRRDWAPVAACCSLIVAALFFMFARHYDYGAYKIILMNWWLMAFLVVLGLARVLSGLTGRHGSKAAFLIWLGAMVCFLGLGWGKMVLLDRSVEPKMMQSYQGIRSMIPTGANNRVALAVDDDVASAWAVYFLRDNPLKILQYRHYMAQPYTLAFMERAEPVAPETVRFVVSDAGRCNGNETVRVVAANAGRYCVLAVQRPDWYFVQSVQNPNGNELEAGQPFYWLGRGDTLISIVSAVAGDALLEFDLLLGPSLPASTPRRLQIGALGQPLQELSLTENQRLSQRIRLQAGVTRVVLHASGQGPLLPLAGADPRPLLLRMKNIRLITTK